ncbi:uncharacterized protein JCM10292_005833 [Rhodotorula paludigena]|uniref:uncharacterized protein n=1 Tax=Rhodotorula paludigena TaxID=86838 RepID=UPI00316CA3D7
METRLPAPVCPQILAPLPAGAPTLLPAGFSVLLAAHHFVLAQIARHPTPWLLTLALAAVAARTALASVFCRFAPAPRPDEAVSRAERRRRQWQIAACEAAGTVLLVFAARSNPVWVWAGTDLLVPLLAFVFDPSAAVANRPSMLRVTLVSSAASFVAVWIWRTEYPIVEGIVIALLAAAVQAARYTLLLREAESKAETDWASLARSQRDTGILTSILLLGFNLVLYLLGWHYTVKLYSQQRLQGWQAAWPVLNFAIATVFPFLFHLRAFDFRAATFAYSAANAFNLVFLAMSDAATENSRIFRFVIFLAFAICAVFQYVPDTSVDRVDAFEQALQLGAKPTAAARRRQADGPRRLCAMLAVLPYLAWIAALAARTGTVDIVVAHFNKPLDGLAESILHAIDSGFVRSSRSRIIIYEKGEYTDEQLWGALRGIARKGHDEIIHLPNWGREGGTYLEHIVAHYNASLPSSSPSHSPAARPLADHTFFLQAHFAWNWIADPRLRRTVSRKSGFVSFGPYLTNLCGLDSEVDAFFQGEREIFEAVKDRKCVAENEGDRVLSTWAGQFVASRKTLLKNDFALYDRLRRMIEAPDDDPIHRDYNPTGPSTQSNPGFGHALERSWPLLLRCDDPKIARECADVSWDPKKCQCYD